MLTLAVPARSSPVTGSLPKAKLTTQHRKMAAASVLIVVIPDSKTVLKNKINNRRRVGWRERIMPLSVIDNNIDLPAKLAVLRLHCMSVVIERWVQRAAHMEQLHTGLRQRSQIIDWLT